ncbi:hypothetical protein AVEN_14890-1 [Araneus ventricosus]|uniref:Uncharacterized protein n=1 Tax=Araneus ventricosus TaxID=182803 RepID=A0A4Y2F6F6_ARAVE|nr:hypothetical protein AVEN_14890-1 [Araneus ventricosus]
MPWIFFVPDVLNRDMKKQFVENLKCFNCKGNHPSYSKTCPKWKLEKEIISVKVTKNISIQEARKIVHDRTPKTNYSYTAALTAIKNPDTPLEPIQTQTDPKPSTSATKNEETIS